MYVDAPAGTGRLGPLLDRCVLDQPAGRAVQNRRGLLSEEIRAVLDTHPEREVRVTSLASGPAAELFDVYAALATPQRLHATCIDIDTQALEFVAARLPASLKDLVRLENGNLVYLALGRTRLDLPPQDLVYSIGLIDYFNDRFVVNLLNYVHGLLRPGGRCILGNFHTSNPTRAFMDHVLDWTLIHRTEDDMHRLFAASAFGGPCERIRFEASGVNLFAVGVRQT
jgi:SAM-dependent methyltransferase